MRETFMTGGGAGGRNPPPTDTALMNALKGALRTDDVGSAELREAIFEFVKIRKSQSEAPQDVIIALKSHVQRVSLADTAVEETELVDRVVKWGIDAYYR
jgi:hypothetical protein